MPELPELDVVVEVLTRRVAGQRIERAELLPPGGGIVARDLTGAGFETALTGATLDSVTRRGKFLIFTLSAGALHLTINPKLTGRLQLAAPADKRMGKTHAIFSLSGGGQLRYIDMKQMGQLYLTRPYPEQARVPGFEDMGPEPLEISFADFQARLRKFQGEIKGVLVRSVFVAGIGNAYADEILWTARIHPYRKRSTLSAAEIQQLYDGMRSTLIEATAHVRAEMGELIHTKPRDFLKVHMKTGQPCPRCGAVISLVGANQRITNFCRQCQPGGLIRGTDFQRVA